MNASTPTANAGSRLAPLPGSAAVSERGRRMAKARWAMDRQRRARLAALDTLQHPGQILLRVIVIRNELHAREAIVWDTDSARAARRKLREILA